MSTLTLEDTKVLIYSTVDKCAFETQRQFVTDFIVDTLVGANEGETMIVTVHSDDTADMILGMVSDRFVRIPHDIHDKYTRYYHLPGTPNSLISATYMPDNATIGFKREAEKDIIPHLSRNYIDCNELIGDPDGLRVYTPYLERLNHIKLVDCLSEVLFIRSREPINDCTLAFDTAFSFNN